MRCAFKKSELEFQFMRQLRKAGIKKPLPFMGAVHVQSVINDYLSSFTSSKSTSVTSSSVACPAPLP